MSPVPRGVPRAPKCASPQRQQVEPPASPQTVWAAKGKLEAHPDPGVAWPGLAQPARSTQPGPQLQAWPTAPSAARVLAALVGVLSVQLLRLHELLQRLVDALSGLRGEQRPRHTHCHVSADRDRDSRVSFHVKRTAFVMKFTVTRVHANDVLPLRKEQVEANRTREEAARCGTIHSSTKPETNRIPRQRIGHADGGTVTHGTSTRQPRCRPLTGPAPGGRGAGHSRDQHPAAEAHTHGGPRERKGTASVRTAQRREPAPTNSR